MYKAKTKLFLFLVVMIPWLDIVLPANAGGFIRNILADIRARGRCRHITAERNVVKVYFMNPDDAKIFANDLLELINNE